jgi:ferritin-like metal-binding protein YciE
MTNATQKIVQYLEEARASELGLVRVLQSQIAMTPRGKYRNGLETHLRETRDHARRIEERLKELGHGDSPIQVGIGLAETVFAQALALGKTPIDLIRGSGGEEKVLKNAKDAAATEALEIATYTAIEQLARSAGDDATARLAASIRADEEKMLARILDEIPQLTDAVLHGDSYDIAKTGAADAARSATRSAARKVGVREPWTSYDKLTVEQITDRLSRATDEKAGEVRAYERAHKNRKGVIDATERELASA